MNLLDQIDPLPKLLNNYNCNGYKDAGVWIFNPLSKRQLEEHKRQSEAIDGEDWRPHTPGFEINGKGQIRTVDYEPPKPPETDIPIPCVVDMPSDAVDAMAYLVGGFASMWEKCASKVRVGSIAWPWPQAEPQTQPAGDKNADFRRRLDEMPIADGWIPHTPGDPMPCDPELMVVTKGRDSEEDTALAGEFVWDPIPDAPAYEITAWKPA